jgi:prevent-host-death family protein
MLKWGSPTAAPILFIDNYAKYVFYVISCLQEAIMTVTISSTEFQRNVGLYTDKAMQEPLIITAHGRDRLALLSIEDYNRFKMLDDRESLMAEDLPEDLLQELEAKIEESKASGVIETNYEVTQF